MFCQLFNRISKTYEFQIKMTYQQCVNNAEKGTKLYALKII